MNPTNDERAQYEAVARNLGLETTRGPINSEAEWEYLKPRTQFGWEVWQAARSQAAPAAQGEAVYFWAPSQWRGDDKPWHEVSAGQFDALKSSSSAPVFEFRTLYTTPQPSAPGVVSDAALDEILSRPVADGEIVDFYLQPHCEVVLDGERITGAEQALKHEVLRTILAAAQPSADDAPVEVVPIGLPVGMELAPTRLRAALNLRMQTLHNAIFEYGVPDAHPLHQMVPDAIDATATTEASYISALDAAVRAHIDDLNSQVSVLRERLAAPPADARDAGSVTIPRDVAELVRKVFLPTNPNKMRSAAPETLAAVRAFIAAVGVP